MWFLCVNGAISQFVYSLQVAREHVGMLVIFGGDVLFYGFRDGDRHRAAEWEEEDVPVDFVSCSF